MSRVSLPSASGLRPVSAFVVVGSVVITVAGWVVHLAAGRAGAQPERLRTDVGTAPAYTIADARGRTLARFVPRFDLEMSPRSMWQAHTPRLMAEEISIALGGEPPPDELLERFLPDAEQGVITVGEVSARQANRLAEWIEGGSDAGPLAGIWIEPAAARPEPTFRLSWEPAVLLSSEERERHGVTNPRRWSRRLADGIGAALTEPYGAPDASSPSPDAGLDAEAREELREAVWTALLPRAHHLALKGLPAERVETLRAVLAKQGVASWQMRVVCARDRFYPAGRHELLGSWGYQNADQVEAEPRAGLELLCERHLADPIWEELIQHEPSVYRWLQDRTVRGHRANAYVEFEPASAAPVVETTLDLALQSFVHSALEDLVAEHRPALAMAIVLDVASGDVLAVDSVEEYEIAPFAPIYHVFTTGSTLKVITMAAALEEGVVSPDEEIQVGQGAYRIVLPDGRESRRVIHEALGAPRGRITVARAFTESCNAGLAQVGLRVSDEAFHGYLVELGYGAPPGAGLGSERAGYLAPLPWKYAWTHASVCFGHEISSTLWQHAAALASVVRGGIARPLRVVRAVEQRGRRWELALQPGEPVFSRATCDTVRQLMRQGAQDGTGKVAREELERIVAASLPPDERESGAGRVILGTKTGTAQKVGDELCVHVELPARRAWQDEGLAATHERIEGLRAVRPPHENCYTSSICAFGRRRGDDREVLVLVVAEEPRGEERYGARVSGPTAARILAEALGFTRDGATPRHDLVEGFAPSDLAIRNAADEPWQETRPW